MKQPHPPPDLHGYIIILWIFTNIAHGTLNFAQDKKAEHTLKSLETMFKT